LLSSFLTKAAWQCISKRLNLTVRELQAVRAILDGQTDSAMGPALGISSETAHTHVKRVFHKLHVQTRAAMVQAVVRCFLRLTQDVDGGLPPICSRQTHGYCPFIW
jgi:DNA-binding CsgD family transcriptional regulator